MNARLDQLLTAAADAWIHPTHVANFFGCWRGTGDLLDFAKRFATAESQAAASAQPDCVVIVEYARWAFSSSGMDASIEHLKSGCDRILEANLTSPTGQLTQAITHTVLAAIHYRHCEDKNAAGSIAKAARAYDAQWKISLSKFIGAAKISTGTIGEDIGITDKAYRLLDYAYRQGAFGKSGVTVSTWMTLHALLSRIFNAPQPAVACSNDIKALMVGHQGHVVRLNVSKLELDRHAESSVFLDPLTFGVTELRKKMRWSIWLASRCARQCPELEPKQAMRLSLDASPLVSQLDGSSAGGLFAVGMIATAKGRQLDPQKSTTCTLSVTKAALEREPNLLKDETLPLHVEDLEIRPIGGVVAKLAVAWQVKHDLNEFFLHSKNHEQWIVAHPNCDTPKVTPITSFGELLDGMWGQQRYDRELERHARAVHQRWDEACKPNPSDDKLVDHCFKCYVAPSLRVEGEKRSPSSPERDDAPVPGTKDSDEPLLNVLDLSFRSQVWPEAPEWLDPKRHDPKRQIVIYDVAGAGKTVCSYRICHLLSDENRWVRLLGRDVPPLVIHLLDRWPREFVTDGRRLTIREVLERHFKVEANRGSLQEQELVRQTIDHALCDDRVVLVVDGFDQFPSDDREHLVDQYEFDPDAAKCRWIVTSRVHTIDEYRGEKRIFDDRRWMRVRIDPFDDEQQDLYFRRVDAKGKQIGARWTSTVMDREAMSELLGLPMVLWMIRVLIDDADQHGSPPPVFYSLSQLYLVTSLRLLARAIERNTDPKTKQVKTRDGRLLPTPEGLDAEQQLILLERVLTLLAFQMMLIEDYNGRREGHDQVERFEELCKQRFFKELEDDLEQEKGPRRKRELEKRLDREIDRWNWAIEVLKTIELSHRSVTEGYSNAGLVFRSRKMVECHAARYLTRYATEWDIHATNDEDNMPVVDLDDPKQDLSTLCAWSYTTHPQWKETWLLAIDMPQEPITDHDPSGTMAHAVIDHEVTCQTLSAILRLPKAYLARDIRPTELIYRAWHLLEYDDQLLQERQFPLDGQLVAGRDLPAKVREDLGKHLLLGQQVGSTRIITQRERMLETFRESSRELVAEFDRKQDRIWIDDQPHVIPADEQSRQDLLAKWQQQPAEVKSHTFLQCPPQSWIDHYETTGGNDPRVNTAIKGHETEAIRPFLMQATTVTRKMYRTFDPQFERTQDKDKNGDPIADKVVEKAARFGERCSNDEFPIICTTWFDSWVFTRWLGVDYRLPSEFGWEFACRAGTTTEFHFGDFLNGIQANCNGLYPYGSYELTKTLVEGEKFPKGPYLERTTSVGHSTYPGNPFGLFDVHGNLWEWCADRRDPTSSDPGSSRVWRGGSWESVSAACRAGVHDGEYPEDRNSDVGFRLCRESFPPDILLL